MRLEVCLSYAISGPMVYADFVLWVVFGPVALVALGVTVRAVFAWVTLGREAASDYKYRWDQGMIPTSVTEEQFVRAYRRSNGPRSAIYLAGTLWAVLLATPVLAKLLEWAFFIFFGLMAGWALIGYIGARQYYRRAPGRLEEELAALRE